MVNFASAPNKGEYMRGFRDGEKSLKDGTGMADPQAEITSLREQVQTLREALQRIYSAAERHLSEQVPSDSDGWYEQPISVLEQARRALTPTAPEANP
jgi:hypothetical protein